MAKGFMVQLFQDGNEVVMNIALLADVENLLEYVMESDADITFQVSHMIDLRNDDIWDSNKESLREMP